MGRSRIRPLPATGPPRPRRRMRARQDLRVRYAACVQPRLDPEELSGDGSLELGSNQRRVGEVDQRVRRDLADECRQGVAPHEPVLAGGDLPPPGPELPVPNDGAVVGYGVLHPVLRRTRGGQVFVGGRLREAGPARHDDARVAP
ncbi:hypothetical protein DM860_008476 [Cuscuta australis]|uniref:Uncharacterized protein n=1 Tax=Cuscuta australis TaxID=267555 RepID=A0A328D8I0_9ASTE|nr:hypothetical protein DM860_008476 [Cuscuta australis]